MAKTIINHMPEHQCYCEVFAGGASVFFRKEPADVEVLNDINSDLITLYKVIKNHLEEFCRCFKWLLISREQFNDFLQTPPEVLTDIQKAVRYYYLVKCGFGARMKSPSFGIAPSSRPRLNLTRIEEDLSAAHMRLSGVYIENLPYAELIRRWDRSYTLFYLDPPYWGCEDDYGRKLFDKNDFETLCSLMKSMKGKAAMSINDVPEIRELFKDFSIISVETMYSIGMANKFKAKELVIMNY